MFKLACLQLDYFIRYLYFFMFSIFIVISFTTSSEQRWPMKNCPFVKKQASSTAMEWDNAGDYPNAGKGLLKFGSG